MFTLDFWRSAAERAVKSFAQTMGALLGSSGIGLWEADWAAVLSIAGMTALLSLLTSVGSSPVGPVGSPSLVPPVHAAAQDVRPISPYLAR